MTTTSTVVVEGEGEMNAALVVSPLNSLDCARINVGRGERETRRRGKMSISTAVAKGDGEGKAKKKEGENREEKKRVTRRERIILACLGERSASSRLIQRASVANSSLLRERRRSSDLISQ